MKNVVLTLFLFSISYSYTQVFYQDYDSRSFQNLLKNGVTYVKTGNEAKDAAYEKALENYWSVTDYTIHDPETATEELTKDNVIIANGVITTTFEYGDPIKNDMVYLIELAYGKSYSKYKSIGYMSFGGFNQLQDSTAKATFLGYVIKGLNDGVAAINKGQIKGKGAGFYKKVSKEILTKCASLKGKTFLLIDETESRINQSVLTDVGIPFKKITTAEFIELSKGDLSDYALFYFARYIYTDASIFNLEDNSLVYSFHFITGEKERLSTFDINKIAKSWEEK